MAELRDGYKYNMIEIDHVDLELPIDEVIALLRQKSTGLIDPCLSIEAWSDGNDGTTIDISIIHQVEMSIVEREAKAKLKAEQEARRLRIALEAAERAKKNDAANERLKKKFAQEFIKENPDTAIKLAEKAKKAMSSPEGQEDEDTPRFPDGEPYGVPPEEKYPFDPTAAD